MDEQEARQLAAQIRAEGREWQTEIRHNSWAGTWGVWAWQGASDDTDADGYYLRYKVDWYKLRAGLREEVRASRENG